MRFVGLNGLFVLPVCLVFLSGGWVSAISASAEQADQDWPAWVDAEESVCVEALFEGKLPTRFRFVAD